MLSPRTWSRAALIASQTFRGNIDDLIHPESAPPSKPVSVQKQPSSQQQEAGKKLLRGPGLRQIEVGPALKKDTWGNINLW